MHRELDARMRASVPLARDCVADAKVSAAALVLLMFLSLWLALSWLVPATPAELRASDPLVQLIDALTGLWIVPIATLCICGWWLLRAPPRRTDILEALSHTAWAVALVAPLALIALSTGRHPLPPFVPQEESARAGLLLGVSAAIIEEAIFRLALLPLCCAFLKRQLSATGAWIGAIALTSLAFALSHEMGPGAGSVSIAHVAVRFLVPGCLMGALFVRPGPAFPVALHCAMHVIIPFLFLPSSGQMP